MWRRSSGRDKHIHRVHAYNGSMDTIIYFYSGKEAWEPVLEKWQEEHYSLIRVGMPQYLWQTQPGQEAGCADNGKTPGTKEKPEKKCREEMVQGKNRQGFFRRVRHLFLKIRQGCGKGILGDHSDGQKKEGQTKPFRHESPTAGHGKKMGEKERLIFMKELQTALGFLANNPYHTYCVYEDRLREKTGQELWRHWEIPEFAGYREMVWAEPLMKYAVHDRLVILGCAPCLPEILCRRTKKTRSIKWTLRETEYTQELQDFMEDFYQEYGLAIEVHLLSAEQPWLRVRPASTVPVNVLDFSGEEKLSACDVAEGSVWLDMDSLEGKCRRMEVRNPGIQYYSLKKQWKEWQKDHFRGKNAPYHLDTPPKNGYNT